MLPTSVELENAGHVSKVEIRSLKVIWPQRVDRNHLFNSLSRLLIRQLIVQTSKNENEIMEMCKKITYTCMYNVR